MKHHGDVLIVPLWNWNLANTLAVPAGNSCSNCTFMELKWLRTNPAFSAAAF